MCTQSSTLLAGGIYLSTNTSTGNGVLIGIGGLLVEILVYLLAGLRASQQTGRVATTFQRRDHLALSS